MSTKTPSVAPSRQKHTAHNDTTGQKSISETDPASIDKTTTVERALDVLTLFRCSNSATLGITEISEAVGLSKAVVHRLLTSFRSRAFVDLDPVTHRYRLGPEILLLGLAYLDRVDMRTLGHDMLKALVDVTGETATLSVRVGWGRVYIDQVTPNRDVKMVVELGRSFPLHAGASSKALLAYMPLDEQEEYISTSPLTAMTARTVTQGGKLRSELMAIREVGYAVSFGERDAGAGSVAAPVFATEEDPVGVISVSGPLERFRAVSDDCARELVAAARELSRRLGHRSAFSRPRD